jgi:hypothetical protein
MQDSNVIYGTDFQARRNREAAAWPDPFEMWLTTFATTALMGDAWLQALTPVEPDER